MTQETSLILRLGNDGETTAAVTFRNASPNAEADAYMACAQAINHFQALDLMGVERVTVTTMPIAQ